MNWLKDLRAAIAEANKVLEDIRRERSYSRYLIDGKIEETIGSEAFLDALVERINKKQLERKP